MVDAFLELDTSRRGTIRLHELRDVLSRFDIPDQDYHGGVFWSPWFDGYDFFLDGLSTIFSGLSTISSGILTTFSGLSTIFGGYHMIIAGIIYYI